MDVVTQLRQKLNRKPTAQEIQDEVLRNMSADKKVKLVSDLIMFARELNNLKNGDNRSAKSPDQSSFDPK